MKEWSAVGGWRWNASRRHGRPLHVALALSILLFTACTTVRPQKPREEPLRGVASWYGEEFAGRTTANGEIFDPLQLTAAHRTLPFGTVLDVTNRKTGQTVRVRVNDRGPFIQGRLIDLSYAAAKQIGLVEPGLGEVDLAIVRTGRGDLEPPVPFDVTVGDPPAGAPEVTPESIPVVPPHAAADVAPAPSATEPDAVVDRVEVQEERGGVATRRQVGADGRTVEVVPVPGSLRTEPPAAPPRGPAPAAVTPASAHGFVVQAGAFATLENAKLLQARLVAIGMAAWIDSGELHRVRIGPFRTRDEAIAARDRLEARGMSAIVVRE